MSTDMDFNPPDGFSRHFRKTPLTDAWEPIFSRREADGIVIGLYVRRPLCNAAGTIHGGCLAAVCDEAMGLNCGLALMAQGVKLERNLATISLSIDFIRPGAMGAWVTISTNFIRTGRSLCFAQAFVMIASDVVARASASFRI